MKITSDVQTPAYREYAGKTRPGARERVNISETGTPDVSQVKIKTSHRQRSRVKYLKRTDTSNAHCYSSPKTNSHHQSSRVNHL